MADPPGAPLSLDAYIAGQLRQAIEARILKVATCLLCGGTLHDHDQAACDAKMAAWQPRGIEVLGLVEGVDYDTVPCPPDGDAT